MGDAYLSHFQKVYAYTDVTASNAPVRKAFDWSRSFQAIPVRNPKSQSLSLEPGEVLSVFSSLRATGIDNDTEFAVTENQISPSVYRFTYIDGQGAAPDFRNARDLSGINGQDIAVTRNANSTATFGSSALFGNVLVGDTVFIPGSTTGDPSGPFSPLNEGFWVVLSATTSSLVLARPSGTVFSAASETVTVATDEMQAFSAAGVQVNDQVRISVGFSAPLLRTYSVSSVTPTWFEVLSATPLPEETGVPTIAGMTFYSSSKRYLRIEADQQTAVRLNGATGDEVSITPFVAGDSDQVGWFELGGSAYSLDLANKSLVTANIEIFSAE